MDDSELGFALRSYASTRWLEVETAQKTFCGWDTRMPGNAKRMADFTHAADGLLAIATPGAATSVPMHMCTHYRGGTGEVLQFTNLGCNTKHVVTTEREKLPENLRNMPEGTDIMVREDVIARTFYTRCPTHTPTRARALTTQSHGTHYPALSCMRTHLALCLRAGDVCDRIRRDHGVQLGGDRPQGWRTGGRHRRPGRRDDDGVRGRQRAMRQN